MKRLSVARAASVSLVAVIPGVAYAIRSSADPVQALIPFVAVWLAAATLVGCAGLYVVHARSRALEASIDPTCGAVLAGFWLRVVAFAIDWTGLVLVWLILVSSVGSAGQWVDATIALAYFVGFWATTGQTVGMMTVGLRVVRSRDGGKLSLIGAVRRFFGMVVGFACLYVGVVWVAFDARKRGWQDLFAGTVVIQTVR